MTCKALSQFYRMTRASKTFEVDHANMTEHIGIAIGACWSRTHSQPELETNGVWAGGGRGAEWARRRRRAKGQEGWGSRMPEAETA